MGAKYIGHMAYLRQSEGRDPGGSRPYDLAPSSFVVFFGNSPYLFRIGDVGEAGHDRPVGAAQDYDARITDEVQVVARRQA